jgi:hypothetical protein
LLCITYLQTQLSAQIGINSTGASPTPSAMLDVSSTTKGALIPRMTTAQKNAIINPVDGLMVFDTDLQQFSYKTGGTAIVWQNFGSTPNSYWQLNSLGGNEIKNTNIGGFWSANPVGLDIDLSTGITNPPTAPIGGVGTRIMWIPSRSAFRVGTVGSDAPTIWNDVNIGLFSFATGYNAKASGRRSIAMGYNTTASGEASSAIGTVAIASGDYSTAMGLFTTASGGASTAMGLFTTASGNNSMAMGIGTTASGEEAIAIGSGSTMASGYQSTAMGNNTVASGTNSTSMGNTTISSGFNSTSIGYKTKAISKNSVAMGDSSIANGIASTAMGYRTNASGENSTSMGYKTKAIGKNSVAMGDSSIANRYVSMAMGSHTKASGDFSTAMGETTTASGSISTAMGASTIADGHISTAMGLYTKASGDFSTAMGVATTASGGNATAVGNTTTASGISSTSMGSNTTASGINSTSMGYKTKAIGNNSMAVGDSSKASGIASTAMGYHTTASGLRSTAMGSNTIASGSSSTAMGYQTTASNYESFATGRSTTASGTNSTAMGFATTASGGYSTAMGLYSNTNNKENAFAIGGASTISSLATNDKAYQMKMHFDEYKFLTGLSNDVTITNGQITTSNTLSVFGVANRVTSNYGYLGNNSIAPTGFFTGSPNIPYSIYSYSRVIGEEFDAFSDARHKKLRSYSNGKTDLSLLNQLKVSNYTFIDTVGKGTKMQMGFIAQQVEAVVPEAVNRIQDYIPSVYDMAKSMVYDANAHTLRITTHKPHDFQVKDEIKLITIDKEHKIKVESIIDANTFVISNWEKSVDKLFVFGKRVDDFRTVDYDRLFTLGISSIQELSRRVEALEKENTLLKSENKSFQQLKTDVAELRAMMIK